MTYSNGDVSVAPASPLLAALCALGNEADVHFLRLLGRSCARRAELALVCARGGPAARAYGKEIQPVDDLLSDRYGTKRGKDSDAPAAGILGVFNLLSEARERVAISYDSILLYTRRTLQSDYYTPLYLLLHAFVEDDADFVHAIVDGARVAHTPRTGLPLPQLDGPTNSDGSESDDEAPGLVDSEDEEAVAAMAAAAARYKEALAKGAEAAAAQRAATDVFEFWGNLHEREPHELTVYFRYVSETRTDMRVPYGEMTLADRLVYLAAALRAWRALPALLEEVEVRAAVRLVLLDAARAKCAAETTASGTRLQQAGLLSHCASGQPLHPGRARIIAAVEDAQQPEQHTLGVLARNARMVCFCSSVMLDGARDDDGELDDLRYRAPATESELPPATGAPRASKADRLPREDIDPFEARFAALCYFARADRADEFAALLATPDMQAVVWHRDALLLRLAAANSALLCLRILLARPDVPSEALNVALGRAAEQDAPLAVIEALLAAGASATAFESYALRSAARFGRGAAVRALLKAGAERRVRRDEALFAAARARTSDALDALLAGVELDTGEWRALHKAAVDACSLSSVQTLSARLPAGVRYETIERALDTRDIAQEKRDEVYEHCLGLPLMTDPELDAEIDKLLADLAIE